MATLTELNKAKSAYLSLISGTLARVHVDQNGERVEFAAANASLLRDWINLTACELGEPGLPVRAPVKPMRFLF